MKKVFYFMAAGLAVLTLFPAGSVYAQTTVKTQVPITYPGDTDETILRRARWIEGAKKEGNTLTWWGVPPGDATKEIEIGRASCRERV